MGNCGVTLTSATRVFLMEPCLDPAHEIQCAGRIHRLGQTKDVLCKRYCFKESFEANVCELHDQIKAGTPAIVDSFVTHTVVTALTNNAAQKAARLAAIAAEKKAAAERKAAAAKLKAERLVAEKKRLAKHKVFATASVGKTIQVKWSTGKYYRGKVGRCEAAPPHRNFIMYDDGDTKWFDLTNPAGYEFVKPAEKNTYSLVKKRVKVFTAGAVAFDYITKKMLPGAKKWRTGTVDAYQNKAALHSSHFRDTLTGEMLYKKAYTAGQHCVRFDDNYRAVYFTLSKEKYELL